MKNPYDSIASRWSAARSDLRTDEKKYVNLLLDSLAANSLVLDVGCGTGKPIAMMLVEAGHTLVGIDRSKELLRIARQNLPESQFVCADIEDVDLQYTFDGAVCWDVLFHIERQAHRPILEKIRCAVRDGGRLILTSGGSKQPPFTDIMFEHTFFYDSHPPDEMTELIEEIGYTIVAAELVDIPMGGRAKGRLAIAADKKN